MREVHLQQKERKVLLMNASYLPNINRYVTFLFYFFAGRVQGPICVDRSSTMIPQPPVKMKSAINNVPSIPMKTPAFVDCKKIVNSFLEPKMRRHLACLLISEEPRIPTRFLAQDPKPSHIDGLPANRPPAADARRFPAPPHRRRADRAPSPPPAPPAADSPTFDLTQVPGIPIARPPPAETGPAAPNAAEARARRAVVREVSAEELARFQPGLIEEGAAGAAVLKPDLERSFPPDTLDPALEVRTTGQRDHTQAASFVGTVSRSDGFGFRELGPQEQPAAQRIRSS